MKVSVLIPAYNAAATIRSTLESVFEQTAQPYEILVFNDGSKDTTGSILDSYGLKIKVIHASNGGLSNARNTMIQKATGDLMAFLDSDDIWHPDYLKFQLASYRQFPEAAVYYTGHLDFYGDGEFSWASHVLGDEGPLEFMQPLDFFERYNRKTIFNFSFGCVPKAIFNRVGPEPFKLDGAEDNYCNYLLALQGSAVYNPQTLVAYRIRETSLSSDRFKCVAIRTKVFDLVEEKYKEFPDPRFFAAYQKARGSLLRLYGKCLMSDGRKEEARTQFWRAFHLDGHIPSMAKSGLFLCSSYLPRVLQPQWPSRDQKL